MALVRQDRSSLSKFHSQSTSLWRLCRPEWKLTVPWCTLRWPIFPKWDPWFLEQMEICPCRSPPQLWGFLPPIHRASTTWVLRFLSVPRFSYLGTQLHSKLLCCLACRHQHRCLHHHLQLPIALGRDLAFLHQILVRLGCWRPWLFHSRRSPPAIYIYIYVAGTFWYNASVQWLLYILLICWVRYIHIVFLVCC